MPQDPRFQQPTIDPEELLRMEAERDKGRRLDRQIASQQGRNEQLQNALEGRTSDIDKPAPGTQHHPRHWYGDDSADKADREAGGRRTIRKIRQAEDAEKAGREDRYEKGITSGLKGTEGEYERKVEIYSQMSPAEMDANYGGPRALTKPLYWENPKTGEREITEAHKDYDPRKLKPVYYTDNQGRPRVKLKKVVRQKQYATSDETGAPIDSVTGKVLPPKGVDAVAPPSSGGGPRIGLPGSSDLYSGAGRDALFGGLPGILSGLGGIGGGVGGILRNLIPSGTPTPGRNVMPGGTVTGGTPPPDAAEEPEDESWFEWLAPGGGGGRALADLLGVSGATGERGELGPPGGKSSGEEAAAGDGEQARALQTTDEEQFIRTSGTTGARGPAGVRGAVGDEGPAGVAGGVAEAGADEYDPAEDWTIGETDKALARAGQPRIGEEDPLAEEGDPLTEEGDAPVVPQTPGEEVAAAMEAEDKPSVIPDPEEIQRRVAEEEEALAGDPASVDPASGVPFSSTNTTTFTGPPDPPAVFGDPSSTFARPGPTEDQLAKRAAEKQRLESRGSYADAIRHGRRMDREAARNAPRFWYTRTGDPRADAAIAAQMAQQMGGVLREQVKGRTAREQMLGQQTQFDKALEHKSDAELVQLLSLPNLPYSMKQAILRKIAAKKGLPVDGDGGGGAGGAGGGARMPGVEGRRQLEEEDPRLLGQLDTMRDEYGTDIGRSGGAPGEWAEWISGVFGQDVQTNNADQLSYTMSKLAGMMKAGSINERNIAAVSSYLSSEYDPAVLAWLDRGDMPANIGGSRISWEETRAFFKDVLAGRIPENPGRYANLGRSWWQG